MLSYGRARDIVFVAALMLQRKERPADDMQLSQHAAISHHVGSWHILLLSVGMIPSLVLRAPLRPHKRETYRRHGVVVTCGYLVSRISACPPP